MRENPKGGLLSSYIIAILAAILFPVFARARESARQANCLSNVRQAARAVLMYTQAYGEMFPPAFIETATGPRVMSQLRDPYIGNQQLWMCPSDRQGSVETSEVADTDDISYSVNTYLMKFVVPSIGVSTPPLALAQVRSPSECPLIWDVYWTGTSFPDSFALYADYRHNEFANFAFADGHAKADRDMGDNPSGNP